MMRYLSGTPMLGLHYGNNSSNERDVVITAYCDADWGGDKADRKSTTGYCVYVNNNLISWNTKKQPTVALSSAEAELMAIVEVVKEVKWMSAVLTEMNYNVHTPITIMSAIKIAQHDVEHDRTKHIDIKHHFVRDEINNKHIEVKWVRSEQQVADIFTKTLSPTLFERHAHSLVHLIQQQQ